MLTFISDKDDIVGAVLLKIGLIKQSISIAIEGPPLTQEQKDQVN